MYRQVENATRPADRPLSAICGMDLERVGHAGRSILVESGFGFAAFMSTAMVGAGGCHRRADRGGRAST
jgi:hypothetical protein